MLPWPPLHAGLQPVRSLCPAVVTMLERRGLTAATDGPAGVGMGTWDQGSHQTEKHVRLRSWTPRVQHCSQKASW